MVGVGGSGMQALAALLLRCGAVVSGSDLSASEATEQLTQAGATIRLGHEEGNVPAGVELVVASAAVPAENPELVAARRRGLKVLTYAQMLGELMRFKTGIAVAGTHGKSTTAGLIAYILRQGGLDPSFVVGATSEQLGGGAAAGDGRHFVAEACEYQRSFLSLRPRYALILNIEEDHLDYYAGLEQIVEAFAEFANQVGDDGVVIANGQDPAVARALAAVDGAVETFGSDEGATWRAVNLSERRGRYQFEVLHRGQKLFDARLGIPGRHNVFNALAAAAAAYHCGVAGQVIADSLGSFSGTWRRLTLRGEGGGVVVLDDYAHHPTEIRATLEAARQMYQPRRLWAIFQPHQHSRTRFLLRQFASSFELADRVVVPEIYFVRDSQQERAAICAGDLVDLLRSNGREAIYLESFDRIVEHVKAEAREGDLIITMGAGDVWKICDELVRWLG